MVCCQGELGLHAVKSVESCIGRRFGAAELVMLCYLARMAA